MNQLRLHLFNNLNRLVVRERIDLPQEKSLLGLAILPYLVHLIIVTLKDTLADESAVEERDIFVANLNKVDPALEGLHNLLVTHLTQTI